MLFIPLLEAVVSPVNSLGNLIVLQLCNISFINHYHDVDVCSHSSRCDLLLRAVTVCCDPPVGGNGDLLV